MRYDEREEQMDPGRGKEIRSARDRRRAGPDRFRRRSRSREPAFLWLLVVPALLLGVWVWRLRQAPRGHRGASRARRTLPIRERFALARRSALLALPDRRVGLPDPRAGAAARAGDGRAAGRRRHRDPAGRLGVDARQGRGRAIAGSARCGSCARSATRSAGTTTASRWRSSRTSPRRRSG